MIIKSHIKSRVYQIHLSKLYHGLKGKDISILTLIIIMNTGWWDQLAMQQWA